MAARKATPKTPAKKAAAKAPGKKAPARKAAAPAKATPKAPKKPRGRPPVEIDADEMEKLGMLQCTREELAAWFGVSKQTIITRMKEESLRDAYERGVQKGLISLRRSQFGLAQKNAAMAIFLGKQYLNQRDLRPLDGMAAGQGDAGIPDLKERMNVEFGGMLKTTMVDPPG